LPQKGYVVPELVLRGTPEDNKPIATHGDMELIVNDTAKTLGIRGRDPDRVADAFEGLRAFYQEHVDPSPGIATHYVELDAKGWVKTDSNPTLAMATFWGKTGRLKTFDRILGSECSNYGLQLCPSGSDPNQADWFHIFLEPLAVSSGKRYRLQWIERSPDIQAIVKRARGIKRDIDQLISRVEGS
jgi:hypothetical protein